MSNFLLQLEASNVDLIPSSLLMKKRLSSSSTPSHSPVPSPQNLIAVDPRTSILYVASYPAGQEVEAESPMAENVARVYAYPYAGLCTSPRRPVEIVLPRSTEKRKFVPRRVVLSPEGDFLAVIGSKRIEVLKLHPILRRLSLWGVSHQKPSDGGLQQVLPERDRADSFGVDTITAEPLFISAPRGATIVDVTWHPLSFTHLVVLTSDNTVTVYNMLARSDPASQEQSIALPASRGPAASIAFACDTAAALVGKGPRTLEERFLGWNALTCFVLYEDGRVDALCPVLPYDVYISKRVKEDISGCAEAGEGAGKYGAFVEDALKRLVDGSEVYDDEFFMFRKDAGNKMEVVPIEILLPIKNELINGPPLKAVKLVYCLGSPSVLIRVTSDGAVDVHVLCSDMCPHWKSSSSVSPPPVPVVPAVRRVVLGSKRSPVGIDPSTHCVVCRRNGAQIFVSARCVDGGAGGSDVLFSVDLSGALECLERRFESEDLAPIKESELDVVVRRVKLGEEVERIFGVGFHGSGALLVLTGDGRLKVVSDEKAGMVEMDGKKELPVVAEPLRIELNDTTNPAYALLCEKMFGSEYLGKITEIKELLLESEKR